MQETKKRINPDDGWVRCRKCGHKLFKVVQKGKEPDGKIEIKCHSCKEINPIII